MRERCRALHHHHSISSKLELELLINNIITISGSGYISFGSIDLYISNSTIIFLSRGWHVAGCCCLAIQLIVQLGTRRMLRHQL